MRLDDRFRLIGWSPVVLVLSALLLVACGDPAPGSALDPSSIPRLQVDEEFRIGVAEGPGAELFGRIEQATVTEGGELWLFDNLPPRIHRFTLDGEPLGTLGRGGEGPGEFSQVRGMLALEGGDVVVLDTGVRRLTRFGPDGTLLGTVPLPEGVSSGPIRQDLAGHLYLRAQDLSDATRRPGSPSYVWLRLYGDLSVGHRLPIPPEDTEVVMVFGTPTGPVAPNLTRTLQALGGTGEVLWARNRSYVLRRGATDPAIADTFGVVAAQPVLKTPGERRELEDRIQEAMNSSRPPSLDSEKPTLQDLSVDQDGRLWVQLRAEAEEFPDRSGFRWQERGVWDVWSPEGSMLGRIELPPMHIWMTARGDRFWVRTFGSMAEPQVVQYRIHWAEAADRAYDGR